MKSSIKPFPALVLVGILIAVSAPAADRVNPYRHIVDQNVFRLLPSRPAGPDKPAPLRLPPPQIFITGLMDIGGVSKALVEISEPGKEVHRHIFAAGGGWNSLQVLKVDVPAGRVRVRWDGGEETLTLREPTSASAWTSVAPPTLPVPTRWSRPVRG